MRGSDPDATLYYLARILQGGEDPKFIARRMVIFASEDIGIAAPSSAQSRSPLLSWPSNVLECLNASTTSTTARLCLLAAKITQTTEAMYAAQALAKEFADVPVPLHLRNAPTKLMKDLGYAQGTEWKAGFKTP